MKPLQKHKIIRTSTVAMSLNYLLKGQLAFLNKHYEVIGVSGQDSDLDIVAKRENIRVVSIVMSRSINLLKDFIALVQLYLLFKKEKPQIVHSITPKAGLLSMIAAKFAGVPIRMHTFTGLIFPSKKGFFQKLLIFMDKVLCKCATHIYPEGEGVKKDLLHYKITSKPLKIIANGNINGIDADYFDPEAVSVKEKENLKKELGISVTDFVFIFVGRLVADKGINELITAFSKLSQENKNCKLVLVGPVEKSLDPLKQETINEIEENKHIIAVGFQEEVRDYYAISDALVFPSYREGFPNVVLQAGAMQLPAIVTNINGCNEIIENNINGLIITVKNSEAIFAAMCLIMVSEKHQELKNNARALVEGRYKQQLVWEELLKEYKNIEADVR
jgi:glycosyltransferase involved in cell wall biosynthesis